jgi:chaperonin GroEL
MFYPLNAPYVNQGEIMQDLATVLGGKYYDYETSSLEDMTLEDVGFASKIIAKRYDAIITGRDTPLNQERVNDRIKELKEKLKGEPSEFAKKAYEARIAQLENGFAIIKVGATSDQQRKYLKDKCDDAVNAVRSAYQEGVVDGGGLAYKQVSEELPEGYILKRPLLSLYNQIMENAPEGYVIEPWVKDPLKVLRVALERACSVASTFATVNIVICNENMPKCKCNGQGTAEKTE